MMNNRVYSSTEKWLITLTVMMVAVMEVLDITIVNVSLRDMMGTFGATISEITWVVTAYVVASAIVMPLTGYLVDNIGRRRLLVINIVGFMMTSLLCGFSTNLVEIILFRTLQGIFGASLIPLSQFVLRNTFSKQELGKAMAVWAMGIMVGPILGPTLGGYITEHLSWHWVFFINIPVCILALLLTFNIIEESERKRYPVDWLGIFFLVVGIGCLQTFIEEGYHYDWFASNVIVCLFVVALFSIIAFILRSYDNPKSVIDFAIFKNQQFLAGTGILTFYSMMVFGTLVMQPLMAGVLMNYPPSQTGLLMAPRGLSSLLFMPLVAIAMKKVNAKILIGLGIIITSIGIYLMSGWNLQASFSHMVVDSIIQGIGMSLVFSPLSTIVFETLPNQSIASASGMFSFGRSMGLSIGVASLSTVLSTQSQVNWNRLGGHITESNPAFIQWLQTQHLNLHDPMAAQLVATTLYQQSSMIAYLDVYWLASIGIILILPLVFLIKKGYVSGGRMGGH